MALTVNTNVTAHNALNNLNHTQGSLSGSFERISSGLRINKAADDAAGLAVAENLSSQARSARVAMRNTNDGISVVQTAEGATDEVVNLVKRMRELAVQSASETLDDDERAYIDQEFEALSDEVDRIAATTEFNGIALTDGSNTIVGVQVGINATSDDQISISVGDLTATTLGITAGQVDMDTASGATAAITELDAALDSLNGYRSGYGAVQNRLESSLNNMETFEQNLNSASSAIRDADFAFETAEMAKHQILQQAGIAVLAQANAVSQGALSLL